MGPYLLRRYFPRKEPQKDPEIGGPTDRRWPMVWVWMGMVVALFTYDKNFYALFARPEMELELNILMLCARTLSAGRRDTRSSVASDEGPGPG